MEISYTKFCDYNLPNLVDSARVNLNELGKYGRMRLRYLKQYNKAEYTILWMSNSLRAHLMDIDKTANERFELLMKKFVVQEDITEELKERNQLEWIKKMNSAKNRVEEIMFKELIFD